MSVNGVRGGLGRLTFNFLERIIVSLDLLDSKLSRTQFLLYLKEKLLLMIFKSHNYMVAIFVIFQDFVYNQFRIIELRELAISISNNIIFQAFTFMLRIDIHF